MKSLFNGMVTGLPKKRLKRDDIFCLGYVDNYDVWLVVEEGEFRIYDYKYWSMDNIIVCGHEDEDWRDDCDTYFEGVDDCLDINTVKCSVAKFSNVDCVDMARELAVVCEEQLEDSYSVIDGAGNPREELVDFIRRGLVEIEKYKDSFVYGYYK